MNLHLEIETTPMHFLEMDPIEIRSTKSPYQYTFTLIDILTNYVFTIPVKELENIGSQVHLLTIRMHREIFIG